MSLQIGSESDLGSTLEITDINDFDLGLLGNKNKLAAGTAPRSTTPPMALNGGGGDGGLKAVDDIEFVNLEDTSVSFDVKPTTGPNTSDTIRILRDGPVPVPPPKPIEAPTLHLNSAAPPPVSAPTSSGSGSGSGSGGWFSKLTGGLGTSSSSTGVSSGGGWFSSSSTASAASPAPATYLTSEQESAKKAEGLTMLERMDRKGVGGTKMTMANTLDEINAEVARRKDSKGLESSIRFQRSMLTTVTHGMEILNSRYDPLGVQLDGWSEQVNENIEDYDEIFEELYDKYKDKSKVAPEVRLIMSLGLSAAMCHVTNSMFRNKMPGMDDLLRNNPNLARQMAQAAAEQAVGPGFAKFVSLGGGGGAPQGGPPRQQPAMPMPSMAAPAYSMEEPMMPPMGGNIGAPIASKDPRGGVDVGGAAPLTARREMRGPTGVDDILAQIQANGRSGPSRAVPPTAIDAEDLGSVGSGMTTETMRRAGLSRRRKTTTAQPVGATLTLNV